MKFIPILQLWHNWLRRSLIKISIPLWIFLYYRFYGGVRVAHLSSFFVCCVSTFWVPCCYDRYDVRIETMFGSSLPLVVCESLMFCLRYLCLLARSGVQHILCCVFVLLCLVYPMLPVCLDCPILIAPSVFSLLPLRCSLTFI